MRASPSRLPTIYARMSRFMAIIAVLAAVAAIIGYLFDQPSLTPILPALIVVALMATFTYLIARLAILSERLSTQRKDTIRSDEDHERRLKILLGSIGDGVVAIDPQWTITAWNPAAERIAGWSAAEAVGKPFRDVIRFVRESDRGENLLFISEAMVTGKPRFVDDRTLLIRKDGSEITVSDSASPIVDDAGQVQGAVIAFRDASAERLAQEARSSFAYASHQLRTPVTVASWSLEAALEEPDQETARKLINDATHAIRSVQKLTEQLVEISEIDNGMIVTAVGEIRVDELLGLAAAPYRAKATERGIGIDLDAVSAPTAVFTDRKLFLRVLSEIIGNAVDFGRQGGKVRVSATIDDRGTRFEISDDGIGISPDQQNVVFTKFFRGQNVPKESAGAGLGLYIGRKYMEILGGTIWFTSEEGKGTVFYVLLPHARS